MTINPNSKLNRYPIPMVEDLFATIANGKVFTKLDLAQVYQQLKLDSRSKKIVVINTHKGLFQYMRLRFGISSAPGIFQKAMETLLQGIPGVMVYIDDILKLTSATEAEHLKALARGSIKTISFGRTSSKAAQVQVYGTICGIFGPYH